MAKKTTARKSAQKRDATPLESIRHKDKRKNIPTEELRDFVTDEEQAPKTLRYPRDPSLDPQLVWQGKDDQDRQDLAVPVVPIYIQEKIHPQAIIDDLIKHHRTSNIEHPASSHQLDLFADFNGLPEEFDQRIDFYQHDANWSNRFILGDSLLVMTSLAEKEGLRGKVQTIYIDPPYGIKFGSNWQVSTRKRDVKDGKAEDTTRQPEQVRAFRDTWKLGIHSYLAYLRDRLVAARELLTETGSVFVQIGDENVHLVRSILDETFGSENAISLVTFNKTTGQTADFIAGTCDYILWYAKDIERAKFRTIYVEKTPGFEGASKYRTVEESNGRRRPATEEEIRSGQINGKLMTDGGLTSQTIRVGMTTVFPVKFDGRIFNPTGGGWKTNVEGMGRLIAAGRVMVSGNSLRYIRYFNDFPAFPITNLWNDVGGIQSRSDPKIYVVQTSSTPIARCVLMSTDPGDLVLDPTCGSGTTAYVAEQWGRRWITCDTSRVALALARTRLMAARFPYYYLAHDYPQIGPNATDDEIKKILRTTSGRQPRADSQEPVSDTRHLTPDTVIPDIRKGFVYKRVPHVTLKSIANNPDIHEGMTRAEIDAAIARHAETETLFDQPYEDKKRVRVSGPFTVESLSPHRTISVEEKRQRAEHWKDGWSLKTVGPDDFGHMVIDNLRKAGVQNTIKNERLKFDELKPYAGEWIHAEGRYSEADGTSRRAAVCIGPEHGTVGAQLVKEAAKEAVKGVGFDILIVCGFAFDPSVSEEARRYGKLTVLPTRMNPDLAMGDELLKKTGAGNLFMVFGEPDIEVRRVSPQMTKMPTDKKEAKGESDGAVLSTPVLSTSSPHDHHLRVSMKSADEMIVVEIKGLDVYDPTTGEIRSSSTDDIACWFIDTQYNGESFFVRHAYFTGADEPYEKLKRALRAEIDEAAWSTLYSTTSRPFPRPETGKIAVKVINHYGDEVMKVYDV
jgi:adenine-specific DNA-methyltransferase